MTVVEGGRQPVRPLAMAAIAVSGVFFSAMLGGVCNAVNGLVSPAYFVAVMRWQKVENIWRAAIAQGIFEGILFGLFLSMVFTAATMIFTRAACTYGFALKHLLGVVAGACLCWFVGGLAGMGLAALSPEFFQHHFVRVPEDWNEMLGYAWAGGSILGLQAGGFVSLVLSLVLLRMNWRRGAGM